MAYRYVNKNPRLQARIFLSNWFVKIVRPGKELPKDQVQMHVSMDMNRIDIKNYLENIYNIKVNRVNTRIQLGKKEMVMKLDGSIAKKKYPDYKIAYVTLAEGTFEYPELFPESDKSKQIEEVVTEPYDTDATHEPEIPEHLRNWIVP
eukprot:gene1299-1436_t